MLFRSIPLYAQFGLGKAWLETVPLTLRLLLTNQVVLGVVLAVGLNVLLNMVLARDG